MTASKCLLLAVAVAILLPGVARAADQALGKRLDDFSLRDARAGMHSLKDYSSKKLIVVTFLGTQCPLARLYAPRLAELSRKYADKGVLFLGVDANHNDTPTQLSQFAQGHRIEFPLLQDPAGALADQLGAQRTPETFVLDQDRVVRYHGRIDDQFTVGVQRRGVTSHELVDALDALLAGKNPDVASTPTSGCVIARAPKVAPQGDITYTKHVATIVNRHCAECHRDGELAPFPLSTYDEVSAWAATIREVVSSKRMPPWFADPKIGKFSNDCSLSEAEERTVLAWIDNGCPQGDPADLPAPPVFTVGWRMGKPDVVYRMPKPFTVQAEGTVDYQYFMVEDNVKEDLWVEVAEARPGNVAVVHHVVLFAVPPDRKISADNLPDAQIAGQMISIYAPGMNPWRYPPGAAMKIQKGSQLVIQTHYTPNGTEQADASYVGLKLMDASKVQKQVRYNLIANANFEIPAGADDYEVRQATRIAKNLRILNLFPHMHYRGKSFRFEAEFPDGHREVLLDVPRYDFNWQLRYDLAEPKLLPKGTRLICIGRYDNSESNPANPDPTKAVRFGLQSWEEMLVGYYTSVAADDDELASNTK